MKNRIKDWWSDFTDLIIIPATIIIMFAVGCVLAGFCVLTLASIFEYLIRIHAG